tara:strand:+ start:80 stop:307 length:228 start_codon:yes stop_codon:yes gene_type:complete
LKIDKGIEIPSKAGWGRWIHLIEKMEIGDSVEVVDGKERNAIRKAMTDAGYGVVQRKNHKDSTDDKVLIRLWRVS